MDNENVVLDPDQIKVIKRLISCITNSGLINFDISDISEFLEHGEKLIYKTATIKHSKKEDVEKSGLLCDELHNARKYLLNIEAGENLTLQDIASVLRDFEERSFYGFGSTYDKYKTDEFKVELFILE